uniref:MULE transposase domain-containing protein n=1 Tax=Cannabis sativa TaxID=3483 RepID=A0A803Q7Q9_CANSA
MFFTLFGNKKYEGGKVSFYYWVEKSEMSTILIEGFAIGLGYKLPFGMLYKPKDKALKHGRMIRNNKEVNEILQQMEMRKWTVMSVYLVMPEMTHELEWKVDPTVVPHVPTAPKLKHCVIEELPPNCDVVPDVEPEVVILSDEDSSENDFEDDEDDFEDHQGGSIEEKEEYEDEDGYCTDDYITFYKNEGWDDPEVQDAGDDAPPIEIQSQPYHPNKIQSQTHVTTPIDQPTTDQPTTNQPTTDQSTINLPTVDQSTTDQPTTNEGEFEFNEEEYEQDLETERNVSKPSDPSRWWASVTKFCSQGGETNERDDGCIELEDDLASLASDDEEGSTTKIKTKMVGEKKVFERVYICLKACKDGFRNGCRPLICLDGTFLKGYCKGILLVDVGIDAENAIFLIAYAVCEKETTDSWSSFCDLLKTDLESERPNVYTFMSDKQKGLDNAVGRVFTGSDIRHCVRHLYSNFKKDFPSLLMKQMLWVVARATTIAEFDRRMIEIKEVNVAAYNWLVAKPPTEWTKA